MECGLNNVALSCLPEKMAISTSYHGNYLSWKGSTQVHQHVQTYIIKSNIFLTHTSSEHIHVVLKYTLYLQPNIGSFGGQNEKKKKGNE